MIQRDYKTFGENTYYHLFNRGNALQDIFLDDEDYEFFILKLKQNVYPDEGLKRVRPLPHGSFSLLTYCLMPNHFHILIKQNLQYTTSQLLTRVCTSYSKYFNRKYKKVGHVFQDKYKQVVIEDDDQLLWLHAYINLNPSIDKVTNKLQDYRWSSYDEILKLNDGFCDKSFVLEKLKNSIEVEKFFTEALPILKINKKLRRFKFE